MPLIVLVVRGGGIVGAIWTRWLGLWKGDLIGCWWMWMCGGGLRRECGVGGLTTLLWVVLSVNCDSDGSIVFEAFVSIVLLCRALGRRVYAQSGSGTTCNRAESGRYGDVM